VLNHFSSTLKEAEASAAYVAVNLKISEDDLRGAQDMQRARELRVESEKAQTQLKVVFGLISTTSDAAVIAYSDPASKASAAVAMAQKLFNAMDALAGDPYLEEAAKLEEKAHQVGAVNAEKKFAAAKTYMKQLNQQLNGLRARFPEYEANMNNSRRTAEESYNKIAQGQKSGNNFNFDRLQQAMDVAQSTIGSAKKVTEAAYGTREALRQLSQSAGDYSSWMAFPSEGRAIIDMMDSEAKTAFDWGVKERQSAEQLVKKFQDMYTVARATMQ
jgi:vacuolar-type H+-ATPase subunit I/STV1